MSLQTIAPTPPLPTDAVAPAQATRRLFALLRRVFVALMRMRLRSELNGFHETDLARLGQSRIKVERWLDRISPY